MTEEEITKPDRKSATLWFFSGLVAASVFIGVYCHYVFGPSTNGIASTSGQVTGSFLVIFLIGYFVNKRRLTAQLFTVCLLLACGVFYLNHYSDFQEAIAVTEGRNLLAGVKSEEEILTIAKKHNENKFLRYLAVILQMKFQNAQHLRSLFEQVSISSTDCPQKINTIDKQAYEQCAAYFSTKLANQTSFNAQLPEIFSSEENEAKATLAKLQQDDPWTDQSFVRSTIDGAEKGFATGRKQMTEMMTTIISVTRQFQALFSFLAQHSDSIRLEGGKMVFANQADADIYNGLLSGIQQAQQAYAHEYNGVQQLEQQRVNQLSH